MGASVAELGRYRRLNPDSSRGLIAALETVRPDVVVCVGYSDPEVHRTVAWALRRGVPLVTCSDSTYDDEPRTRLKEALKRVVVSAFDSGLVAGIRSHEYLGTLGMDGDRRFSPWDVVDNEYFRLGAELARRTEAGSRARLGLPKRYFLCVARFVPKKNLGRLIEGYAEYARSHADAAWSLVLSGAGPDEGELRFRVAQAGLTSRVHFSGFLQYPDLPACYGLAEAFVLASDSDQWGLVVNEAMASGLPVIVSKRCGCAPDLVREGENGLVFDPDGASSLADALGRLAQMDPGRRAAMGVRSMQIIAGFSPEDFAVGLRAATECAVARRRRRGLLARTVVGALGARSVG